MSQTVLQVKVQTWVDGVEASEFVGVGARFGTTIESKEKKANQTRLILSNPRDCCSKPKNKVFMFNLYFPDIKVVTHETNKVFFVFRISICFHLYFV